MENTPHPPRPASCFAPAPPAREATERQPPPPVLEERWERGRYEMALRYSALRPEARLIAFVLSHYSARSKGTIPSQDVPGTYRLAKASGLSERSARNSMLVLEREGWVRRPGRPDGRPVVGERPIRLTIPAGTPLRHSPDRTADSHTAGHDHHAP